MPISTGYTDCMQSPTGGVRAFYVANWSDVDQTGITIAGQEMTAIAMNGGATFYKVTGVMFGQGFEQMFKAVDPSGSQYVGDQKATFRIKNQDLAADTFLQSVLEQSGCGMVVIVTMNDGTSKILGWIERLWCILESEDYKTGMKLDDLNEVTVTITCKTSKEGRAKTLTAPIPL